MQHKKNGILFIAILVTLFTYSQKTTIYTNNLASYNEAIELYQNKSYNAAQAKFKDIAPQFDATSELKANCEFYIADCAIKLGLPNSDELMQKFVTNYPTSTKQTSAFLHVANYYFKIGKYSYAAKWYSKINPKSIGRYNQDEFNFKYAYSLFVNKSYVKSKKLFFNLFTSQEYGAKAKYYYGYIAYKQNDYSTAEKYLSSVETNENFKTKVSYYLADMNFKLGKFQKAIDNGLPLLDKAKGLELSEISKIIGESYFNLQKFKEAIPYLKNYKGKRGKWTNTDYYLLGYAYYKQNDYENAINTFNKIISGNNEVAQNAYYHLAECYLQLNKKPEALNAFRNAAHLNFNTAIQKDAWYNYAKLSYDIGNPYKSVPNVLQEYLDLYPKSEKNKEIKNLLVSAYITSRDFKGALDYLDKNKSDVNQATLQEVAYYRGIELFNEQNFALALENFEKSLANPVDSKTIALATYWKAESNYRLNNFTEALYNFKSFFNNSNASNTEEFKTIHYNLGYTYFKLKDYPNAIREFKLFDAKNTELNFKNDSYLRIADSYFVTKKYTNAIEYYKKSIESTKVRLDYAQFQIANCYGFLGKENAKIKELQSLLNKHLRSIYNDDALYILGNSYIKQQKIDDAIASFNQLISTYKRSPLVPKAILKKGLIYYNSNKNQEALTAYKKVVSQFPKSPEAQQAVKNAREIYVDIGQVDAYAKWVKTIDFVSVSNAELDDATYEAAEKQYLLNNTKKAITNFEKYLESFNNGLHSLQANFYLGQLLTNTNQENKAVTNYTFVIEQPQNEFTEKSLVQLSLIYLKQENWQKAIPLLTQLESSGNSQQNIEFAQANLMKAYYHQKNYDKAVNYAESILKNPKIENKTASDAQLIIARSAIKTNNFDKARKAYSTVEKIASGELKAEALYYHAYFENKDGSYRVSNEIVQKVAANYASYKYWAAKSLLIMADNYHQLKDAFQATYILESVIKNFSEFDDVITEAKSNLKQIKAEQAKTNESVNTNKN